MKLTCPRVPFIIAFCSALFLYAITTPTALQTSSYPFEIRTPYTPSVPCAQVISWFDRTMSAVCHIQAETGWQGSGAYIGDGLIISAGHVVNGAESFTITFENDPCTYTSSTFYVEPAADVGFIYLENYDGPSLSFNNKPVFRGDAVWSFGNAFGMEFPFSVTEGIISHTARDVEGTFGSKLLIQSNAPGFPGCSGGPVTNEQGQIIGIVVGGPPYGFGNIALYIPANICRKSSEIYLKILEMSRLK